MSLNQLEKIRIIKGNDMSPAIDPKEYLLLDKKITPKPGDILVFTNRFGLKIAHRMIYSFRNYFFLRGDNCPCFDFPCNKKFVLGVVNKKYRKIKCNFFAKILLVLFLFYYIIYSKFFNIKKKKKFLILKIISKFVPPIGKINLNNKDI